jgi:hypothetical protein
MFVLTSDTGMVEVSVPIDGNQNLGAPSERLIPPPLGCEGMAPDNMRLREVYVAFGKPNTYAVTCNNDAEEYVSFFGTEDGGFEPLGPKTKQYDGLVRQYLRLGNLHFMRTGEDLGKVGYRMGVTVEELKTVQPLSFDDMRLTSTNATVLRDGSGLFFYGGAVTGADNPMDPPPLIPAEFFAGSVPTMELPSLRSSVPPSQLVSGGELTKQTDIVLFDAIAPIGDFIFVGGQTLAPPDAVKVSMLHLDGNFAVRDFAVYQEDNAQMDGVAIAPLGIGIYVAFIQDSALKGRSILCGED